MNARFLTVLAVMTIFLISATASASMLVPENEKAKENKKAQESVSETSRWIAHTTSSADKMYFRLRGCEIVNELDDATAIECPKNVKPKDAEPDELLYITDLGADAQINADDAWLLTDASGDTITGKSITVAVLDTGVDYSHPEILGSVAGGKSFVKYTKSYYDDHGHGTHVSGIITADGVGGTPVGYAKGVASGARVWMGKVCSRQGSCLSSDIAKGIQYVVNNNIAKIMSISIGGGAYTGDCDSTYLASQVNWAADRGVSVVVAAGNSASGVSSPGCASKAITVGAVDKTDVLAYFSGRGASMTNHGIVAPGVSIYSTLPRNSYASWSGTSMATPHVAATIALMKQKNAGLTDSIIKNILWSTSADLGDTGADNLYGHGRIDALAAVNAA